MTGSDNTAIGAEVMRSNTGNSNVAMGSSALHANVNGSNNTVIGTFALAQGNSVSDNIAVGFGALPQLRVGSFNIAIGEQSGVNLQQGQGNIYLGNFVTATTIGENRVMRLGGVTGTNRINRTFIGGVANVNLSGLPVVIDSHGQLGVGMSSVHYKRDIQPMEAQSQKLFQLRPVTFRYKEDVRGELQYGLIAEEVAKVYPELVVRDANDQIQSVKYNELIPMLLNELQHQQQQLAANAQELNDLKAETEHLRTLASQQQGANARLAERLDHLEAAARHVGR